VDKLRITGGRPLEGEVRVSGAKNAALPIMCAALLTDQALALDNVPRLMDVRTMAKLLAQMGVRIGAQEDGRLELQAAVVGHPEAPYDLVKQVAAEGRMPVVNFVAGGISTPADAALVMQLGAEGVFVGSGIFKAEDPARMANAIVQATTHFSDPTILAEVSKGLGAPMRGIAMEAIPDSERLAVRGW